MTSCETVFSIAELAEAVFLELSMTDLLCTVQQTCKLWKATVDSSTRLQQALYFTPVRAAPVRRFEDAGRGPFWAESRNGRVCHYILEHPLITRMAVHFDPEHNINVKAAFSHGATWKRAQITQPPVAEVRILSHERSKADRHVANNTGITLGELIQDENTLRELDPENIAGWGEWGYYNTYSQLETMMAEYGRE